LQAGREALDRSKDRSSHLLERRSKGEPSKVLWLDLAEDPKVLEEDPKVLQED
jgi:hypothetical protein